MSISYLIDVFLHLDKYLDVIISQYDVMIYLILFLIIFIETGVVIMPFLPGDSLIFATAAVSAAGGAINAPLMIILFYIAAITGDTMNYHIGHLLREKVRKRERIPLIKMEYIDRTQAFFEKNGGKTIIIARFVPIIRTFAPFLAGVGEMPYRWFLKYNVAGGVFWVSLMFFLGYFFGNIGFIKDNFSLVVVAIIVISLLPAIVTFIKSRVKNPGDEKQSELS